MKKIIYRKLLSDCFIFFLLSLFSLSVIIWVFQAVNYLDLIIDDGRDFKVYLGYSFLNFPKIITKIFPFAIFFSFTYVLSQYELNNNLLIFWSFGISKIKLVNFFLVVSVVATIISILLNAYLVPKVQDIAKSLIRNSNINVFENFIKTKVFNDAIKGLTVYIEKKNENGDLKNIYLKKQSSPDQFQITYAKQGFFKKNFETQILVLLNGETISSNGINVTNFSFSQTDYNLSNLESNTSTYIKTQELLTKDLFGCIFYLTKFEKIQIKNFRVENCRNDNLQNIYRELYKRIISPLFVPVLIMISLLLIMKSKERINYSKYRITIFLFGFIVIIFSETVLRFISNSFFQNLKFIAIPISLVILFYLFYIYKLQFINLKK